MANVDLSAFNSVAQQFANDVPGLAAAQAAVVASQATVSQWETTLANDQSAISSALAAAVQQALSTGQPVDLTAVNAAEANFATDISQLAAAQGSVLTAQQNLATANQTVATDQTNVVNAMSAVISQAQS